MQHWCRTLNNPPLRVRHFAHAQLIPLTATLAAASTLPHHPDTLRAETVFNARRIVQGRRLNPRLNRTGSQQAANLGRALSSAGICRVYASPLARAKETAAAIAAAQPPPPPPLSIVAALTEVDFGGADGIPQAQAAILLARSYAAWSLGQLEVKLDVECRPGYPRKI